MVKRVVKSFSLLLAFCLLLIGSVSAATMGELPESEASLGGIGLNSTMGYVESVYGELFDSYWTTDYFNQDSYCYRYGKGFYIYTDNGKVEELFTNKSNGIATPMGITVGIPMQSVFNLWGYKEPYDGIYRYSAGLGPKEVEITTKKVKGQLLVKSILVRFGC